MLNIYLLTLGGLVLAQLAPGPNLLSVAGAALGDGLGSAFFVTLGIATAIFIWVVVAACGLATLMAIYPPLLVAMKLAGGAYLCVLALRAFRSAASGSGARIDADRRLSTPIAAWRRGMMVNLTNPKSALMWGALTTFMFGSGLSVTQVLGFAPLGFASAMLVYGTYALLFSTRHARRVYARFTRAIGALLGAAFGALGVSLIVDGLRSAALRSS